MSQVKANVSHHAGHHPIFTSPVSDWLSSLFQCICCPSKYPRQNLEEKNNARAGQRSSGFNQPDLRSDESKKQTKLTFDIPRPKSSPTHP